MLIFAFTLQHEEKTSYMKYIKERQFSVMLHLLHFKTTSTVQRAQTCSPLKIINVWVLLARGWSNCEDGS